MKKIFLLVIVLAVLVGGFITWACEDDWCYVFPWQQGSKTVGNDQIQVSTPIINELVKSPLVVSGKARGTWYFEASFPVRLFDANGKELAIMPASAKEDWMTTEFVPFEVTLAFPKPTTATGILVLEKDNPSGLSQYDQSISIPVRFK